MNFFSKWAIYVLLLVALPAFSQTPQSVAEELFVHTITPAEGTTPFPADAGFFRLSNGIFFPAARGQKEVTTIHNFPLGSQSVTLDVTQFQVLANDAVIGVTTNTGYKSFEAPAHIMLHGEVREIEGSHVFLAVFQGETIGYISIPEGSGSYRYLVQPVSSATEGQSTMIVYKEHDVDRSKTPSPFFNCASESLLSNKPSIARIEKELSEPVPQQALEILSKTVKILKIDIEADNEYFLDLKSDTSKAAAYAIADIGAVSDIYIRDLSAAVQIQRLHIWTVDDPFPGQSTEELLMGLDSWGPQSLPNDNRAACILLSGINAIGGLAHLGVICPNQSIDFGYCVCGTDNNYTFPRDGFVWDVNVVAHEFGHNIGSPHTHNCSWNPAIDSCYAAEGGCFQSTVPVLGTIMSYCHLTPKGIEMKFHTRNIPKMKQWIAQASCAQSYSLPLANAGSDMFRCGNDSTLLSGSATDGIFPYKYSWRLLPNKTELANTRQVMVKPTATTARYVLTVTDANNLRTYDTLTLTADNLTADAGSNIAACGVKSVVLDGTAKNGLGIYTYQWLDSATGVIVGTTSSVNVPFNGTTKTYTLKVVDSVGCISTDNVVVSKAIGKIPTITAQGPLSLCEGDSVMLDAGAGFLSYLWSNGIGSRRIWVKTEDVYWVVTTSAPSGCSDTSASINVTVSPAPPKPIITINGGQLIASQGVSYQWYRNGTPLTGATTQTYIPTSNGNFYVAVTAIDGGCSSKSDVIDFTLNGSVDLKRDAALSIRPNPASDHLSIMWGAENNTSIIGYITDIRGARVLSIPKSAIGGTTEVSIDIRQLAAGSYTLHCTINGTESAITFIKQ